MKMKLFRRNAVILTVVAFLGVAVYLNWSYAKNEDKAAAGVGSDMEEALLEEYAKAEEQMSLFYEPEDGTQAASAIHGNVSEYFAEARLTRQQARDSAIGILKEATELENATQEAIDSAMEEISVMAGYSLDEVEIETLIKAKGFDDCVVFLGDDSATVAVSAPTEGLSSSAVSRITDIILSETGISAEQIKIIEVK
ncbi:MAG: SpoIIIAH-like family protein [Clostridiales bacterium]|nr:SpoIIIAH-like family protein [Clostridiales bacterium]